LLPPPSARPGHPYLAGRIVFCAHRGGAKLAPENTMAAFRPAVEAWAADMLELDVHATADGRIVVIHDATVDRTTDGTGRVAEMRWDELRELDAGCRFRDPEGRASFSGGGVRIPLLDELLEAFPRTRLNVEAKDARAAPGLVALIRRHGATQRVLVAAEHEKNRRDVRGYPGPWGASARQLRIFWALHGTWLSPLYTPHADIFQVPFAWQGRQIVTERFLTEAHRRNIPVHVWTVDDEALMRRLVEMGVDGIQTDRPDVLARVLSEVAGRPSAPALRRSTLHAGARSDAG
jgi:glycerophosphoryl diester phosphodiesterase